MHWLQCINHHLNGCSSMKSSPFWVISARNRTSIYFWAVAHIRTSGTTFFLYIFSTHTHMFDTNYSCLLLIILAACVWYLFFIFLRLCVVFDVIFYFFCVSFLFFLLIWFLCSCLSFFCSFISGVLNCFFIFLFVSSFGCYNVMCVYVVCKEYFEWILIWGIIKSKFIQICSAAC